MHVIVCNFCDSYGNNDVSEDKRLFRIATSAFSVKLCVLARVFKVELPLFEHFDERYLYQTILLTDAICESVGAIGSKKCNSTYLYGSHRQPFNISIYMKIWITQK